MGFGESTKSSTKCKLVDDLEGTEILGLALGYATSLVLLDPAAATPGGQVSARLTGRPLPALPEGVAETHVSLFDGSNCGISIAGKRAFGVQYHPEASPGPQDSFYLFEKFVGMLG